MCILLDNRLNALITLVCVAIREKSERESAAGISASILQKIKNRVLDILKSFRYFSIDKKLYFSNTTVDVPSCIQ